MGFKPVHKRVAVYWTDACSYDAWEPTDEKRAPMETVTVGHLVRKTKTHVEVSASVQAQGCACQTMVIPMGMVRRIERL